MDSGRTVTPPLLASSVRFRGAPPVPLWRNGIRMRLKIVLFLVRIQVGVPLQRCDGTAYMLVLSGIQGTLWYNYVYQLKEIKWQLENIPRKY